MMLFRFSTNARQRFVEIVSSNPERMTLVANRLKIANPSQFKLYNMVEDPEIKVFYYKDVMYPAKYDGDTYVILTCIPLEKNRYNKCVTPPVKKYARKLKEY